jgi:hypothetical protein
MTDTKITEQYQASLSQALSALFREKINNGFWDEQHGRIIKRLVQDHSGSWTPDESFDLRYGPFGLMGVLYWRYRMPNETNIHDEKIVRYLDYLVMHVDGQAIKDQSEYSGLNYGVMSSFALGYLVFKNSKYLEKAREIFASNKNLFCQIRKNILSLVIWGECWLWEALNQAHCEAELLSDVKEEIRKKATWFIQCQDRRGYFITGDFRSIQFARTMYILWSLAKAIPILGYTEWFKNIERALDYHLNSQMTEDGAFLWHPKFYFTRISRMPFLLPIYHPFGAEWLFECHQTFFVNAVEQYRQAGGPKDYRKDEIAAVDWVFGRNRINKNLIELSGLGVPIRVMTLSGQTFVPQENFKGTYEIGSYVMAMSDLVKNAK